MDHKKTVCALGVALWASGAGAASFGTFADAMMEGVNGAATTAVIFTVGETFSNGYTPPGLLDGIGAYALDDNTVRVMVNHELRSGAGAAYALANGTRLKGARVSYFDIDSHTRRVVDAGLAYGAAYDRSYRPVSSATMLSGFNRFCSGQLVKAGDYGFVDNLYFTGEEGTAGTEYVIDTRHRVMHAAPALGRASWENVTPLQTGNPDKVALLIGDDRAGQAALLYVGEKDATGDHSFLDRNGLKAGRLYAWVSDTGETAPSQFNSSGSLNGSWVAIDNRRDGINDGVPGDYDADGWATQDFLDAQKLRVGAFRFSRPEDVATDPNDGTRAVMASTGHDGIDAGADSWGTLYRLEVDFGSDGNPRRARVQILYDGDAAGDGLFAGPDFGPRSPDNTDWADDGSILVQEDRSVRAFGLASGEETSIWRFGSDAAGAAPLRVARVDRSAVPADQAGPAPSGIGEWESSGILDVSVLFGAARGTLFLFDVQAHSLRGGPIARSGLVEGGQLLFLAIGNPVP
ncbi:MAG: PhoX family protein [Chromatiaceae bacterium]|nr:PhoX family protein [Chromatiaceae bacterium]